jgi:hypothetical protein
MTSSQSETMRWYLFWVFISLFVIISILTILALFFEVGQIGEDDKGKLVTAFLLEVGLAVGALFYSLFKLKPPAGSTIAENLLPAEVQENVGIITSEDAPFEEDITIDLSQPTQLDTANPLASFKIGGILSQDFQKNFTPAMITYIARVEFGEFRPNVILTFEPNPLFHLNMTLADYVTENTKTISGILALKDARQVRSSFNAALQWYSYEMPFPTQENPDNVAQIQAFQKYVVAGEQLATLTITYQTEGTDPDHIHCLHQLLKEFGVAAEN